MVVCLEKCHEMSKFQVLEGRQSVRVVMWISNSFRNFLYHAGMDWQKLSARAPFDQTVLLI